MASPVATWFDYEVCTVNTFLHFSVPVDAEDSSFRRQLSDPSFCRGKFMTALQDPMQADHGSYVNDHGQRPLDMDANVVDESAGQKSNGGGTPNAMDQAEQRSTSDGAAAMVLTSNRPRWGRPCKGQRDRYRKLVERLFQQIRRNPCGVSYDEIQCQLPPSVAGEEWRKNKLIRRLQKEQARLVQSEAAVRKDDHEPAPGLTSRVITGCVLTSKE